MPTEVRLLSLESRAQSLKQEHDALYAARFEGARQLAEMRRELRCTSETLSRVVDELTPLKLLSERAVLASERSAQLLAELYARCPACAVGVAGGEKQEALIELDDVDLISDVDANTIVAPDPHGDFL